jgi:hypothetical protein
MKLICSQCLCVYKFITLKTFLLPENCYLLLDIDISGRLKRVLQSNNRNNTISYTE